MLFLLLSVSLFGCNWNQDQHRDYEVLFTVNDVERTVFDFESEYVEFLIQTGRNDSRRERYSYLNNMIDNLLLAQAAPERGLLEHPTYLGALEFQQRKSMMDVYFIDEMDKVIEPPTDDEVRLAYDKKQRKVYVRQLFSLKEEELLEPYQRLKSGEDFVDVANDYFETEEYDPSAGYLGPISYFGVDHAFAEAAFSTNQGEFTAPVRSRFGYHIIYVEYIEFPVMLAEDDYQYRKPGITSQLRLRRQQITSDSFVRELMESLVVEANNENLAALREVIIQQDEEAIPQAQQNIETPVSNWSDSRLDLLESSFPNEAVLATYVFGGERMDFTFDDYLKWLPYLSFQESKSRTGASVGRALRNEVLYLIAEENNYAEDDRVVDRVQNRGYEILSELYQYELTIEAISDTTSIEVPNSFRDRLINDREELLEASYWVIPVEDVAEARLVKDRINEGSNPESFPSYFKKDYQAVEESNPDHYLVSRGIINTPLIANSEQYGWVVINVIERDVTEIGTSTSVENLETRYKVFSSIDGEIEELRKKAVIKIDTLLFDDIYKLWNTELESE